MFSKWAPMCLLLTLLGVNLVTSQISFGRFPNRPGSVTFPLHKQSPRPIAPTSKNAGSGCNCIADSACSESLGQLKTECVTERGGSGICCIQQAGVVISRVGFNQPEKPVRPLSSSVLTKGLASGQKVLNEMKKDVQIRLKNREFLKRGSPARAHAFFFQRSKESIAVHEIATHIAQASVQIAKSQALTPEQSFFELPQHEVGLQVRTFRCPGQSRPRCDARAKFRTIDGTCNNLRKPNFGKSNTAFSRLTQSLYADGIMEPREFGTDNLPLPNVREASNNILIDLDIPDTQFTLNLMQWSQFVDHDLTLSPFMDLEGEAIMCCEDGRIINPQPEGCFPIKIPQSDQFFATRGQGCINFVRSMLAPDEDCRFGPVEQLNALTHWLDGSMIYGSTEEEKARLIDGTGLLATSENDLPPIDRTGEVDCEARVPGTPCYLGGDSRITEQPALTVMHVVWIREHNRIARFLKNANPSIDATQLFEQARRIVIAEVQHITFSEWLPIIIGESTMRKLRINTLKSGYRNKYDPSIDPAIFNEFATAAFRFGHSLVQGIFSLISATGRSSTMQLRNSFNAPNILMDDPQLVDDFVRGLTNQRIQTMDNFITQDLTNHLFQTPGFDFGMDLMSLNIQRGREHAIGTYNQHRSLFGLSEAKSFSDLRDTTSLSQIIRIQTVYRNVDDIDLFVGGMTEKHLQGALLGPLFASIVGKQFQQLMNGDRFFYDIAGQPGSFTPEQLHEIRKSSLAKVFCDNTNVKSMQHDSFVVPNRRNPLLSCDKIPGIDLNKFRFV